MQTIRQISWEECARLRENLPVVDVRSQAEFTQGHIPGARNIPLLNDDERVVVGTAYKKEGQQKAIHEGFRLVGPRLMDIVSAAEALAPSREIIVHCWRGGMRSNNFAQFVGMAGIKSNALIGGYKAYRGAALASFEQPYRFLLLAGCTGSGKSEVLRALGNRGEQIIDLEALACHKGSAFGALTMPPQPTTEQFQNDLFEALIRLNPEEPIWIEDESIAIGKIFLPTSLWQTMTLSPIIQMEVEKPLRIDRLVQEYSPSDKKQFLEAMTRITKKLGGQHFNSARDFLSRDDWHSTIDILLTYYDKAYLNSIHKRENRIHHVIPWDGVSAHDMAERLIDARLERVPNFTH